MSNTFSSSVCDMTNASSTISCVSAASFTAQLRELSIFPGYLNGFLLVSDAREKKGKFSIEKQV